MTLLVFRVDHDSLVTEFVSADHETKINIVGISTDFTSCVTVCLIGATSDNSVAILFVHEAANVTNVIQFWCQHLTTAYCYAHGVVSASRD